MGEGAKRKCEGATLCADRTMGEGATLCADRTMGEGAKRKCEGATLCADRKMVRDVPPFKQALQMGRRGGGRGREGAKRGKVCSLATCEVPFGAWRRARARSATWSAAT